MTDAWFENAIESDGIDGEGCRRSEAMTLKSYLRDEIAVNQASQQLAQPTENCAFPGDPLIYLWGVLQDAMVELPGSAAKIVPLLLEMQKRSDMQLRENQREGALSDRQWALWRDLPGFANLWYDMHWWYYSSHWRVELERFDKQETVANISRIATADALLAVYGILGERAKAEGLARLADSLEDESAVLRLEMPIVKEWLLNAGDMLFEMCKAESRHCLLGNSAELKQKSIGRTRRELWKGESGPSLARCQFWEQRLGHIEQDIGVEEKTRDAARVSLRVMEQR
ncbi:unnamed protein product [Aureobasidium vineae]|uniref:Uncharacterized protein n=1 Tax=Aureobasidium vineae TaxID=2773715 RepID=A0A9N8JN61_9PEZI|nr:unnamed protein product [Aureobasidium vineae]